MATITDFFGKASVDTDHSVATTITADRTAGVTVLNCFDLSTFTEDTPVYFVTYTKTTDPLTSEVTITDTISWKGLVNAGANTITNLVVAPGYIDTGNTDGQFVECIPTSYWANELVDGIQAEHNPDGSHSNVTATTVTADEFILTGTAGATQGWQVGLPAVSTVTHNGNRSYDVVFASTVASTLSEGMRLEFTKATAGNAYMGGAFNGSSHYFTKTAPLNGTLGTVTNNFTIEATYQPTSYADCVIAAREDSSVNNGWELRITNAGQVAVTVFNGGVANYRQLTTYQSLPLNKKTAIAGTWASGTVTISFDGIPVPVSAAVTSGTAPTTAGTGGDFSIGRRGASGTLYANGYISNVAVFDAVLSASTIKDHYTKKLTGSETNCIGAWSLDNTANDQSSAGNNLTATGGVGYTAMSPHGQLGNGVETTKAVGLVTNVNGTTVTVQCPEGVTIPSGSSTISSVAYSTQANPFGWVSDKGRWEIRTQISTSITTAAAVSGTMNFYSGAFQLTVPTGKWIGRGNIGIRMAASANTYITHDCIVSTTTSLTGYIPDSSFEKNVDFGSSSTHAIDFAGTTTFAFTATTATPVYVGERPTFNGSPVSIAGFYRTSGAHSLVFTPSCL